MRSFPGVALRARTLNLLPALVSSLITYKSKRYKPDELNQYFISADLAVGVVAECLMSLVKHNAADGTSRTRPSGQVVLQDLRSEEEHSSLLPLLNPLTRREVAWREMRRYSGTPLN